LKIRLDIERKVDMRERWPVRQYYEHGLLGSDDV
jgi:hypothetical protein